MLFEDAYGNLLHPEQVDELGIWEIEERGIHVWESNDNAFA